MGASFASSSRRRSVVADSVGLMQIGPGAQNSHPCTNAYASQHRTGKSTNTAAYVKTVVHAFLGHRAISFSRGWHRLDQQPPPIHDNIIARRDSANARRTGEPMQVLILSFLFAASDVADLPRDVASLTEAAVVRFATPEEGRENLTADDAFTVSLSRFDLQCRLK